jgi:hypothetical protein
MEEGIYKLEWEVRTGRYGPHGVQGHYTFQNGHSISVILHTSSMGCDDGLWEIWRSCD